VICSNRLQISLNGSEIKCASDSKKTGGTEVCKFIMSYFRTPVKLVALKQSTRVFLSFLYRASCQHMKRKTNRCHYFNFIHVSTDLYMFRAHRPILRRIHTTIGSVAVPFGPRARGPNGTATEPMVM
jgi:hypothetical protein